MMVREKRDINPILFKFGGAVALSFAGYLFSRFRTRRLKPSKPPPSLQIPRSSEHINGIDSGGGKAGFRYELHASQTTPGSSHMLSIVSEKHEDTFVPKAAIDNFSPSSRDSGDRDRYLLPEFNELVKEINFSPTCAGMSPRKDVETPRSDLETPKAFKTSEKDEYEQEIKHLKNMVRILRESERNLEVQLLEYYGLKEQETTVMELQTRLKLNNMEAKLFSLKIESLKADNRRLESQVSDYGKVVGELEAAKGIIKILKRKLRSEAEHNREHILNLQKRVENMQDEEHNKVDSNGKLKDQRLKELENEAGELKMCNTRLQMENSELARRLESTQILASSVLEDPEGEGLREMSHRLRKENEELSKEIERLQADRCADVEELVYLRWINACLRFELRNYQPQPGKAVARDLSKTLSPKSEEKAKQLILEYANTEGGGEKNINLIEFDSDQWSSSQASYLTDSGEYDDSPAGNSSENKTNKTKFFTKLRRLLKGKDSPTHHHHHHHHQNHNDTSLEKEKPVYLEENMGTYSNDSPNFSSSVISSTRFTSPSQSSSRQSLDIQKLRRMNIEDVKDLGNSERNSDVGSSFSYKRFVMGGSEGVTDHDSESSQKSELVKYAEVLRHSRSNGKQKLHKKSKSFSSY